MENCTTSLRLGELIPNNLAALENSTSSVASGASSPVGKPFGWHVFRFATLGLCSSFPPLKNCGSFVFAAVFFVVIIQVSFFGFSV